MTYAGVKHMEYIYGQLDNDDIRFIKTMPIELTLDYHGRRFFFTHYSHDFNGVVQEDMDIFNEALLDKMFHNSDVDAVFFGHVHARKLLINPSGRSYFCLGSSGCVKSDKTYYTYVDVGGTYKDNYDIYRIDLKFNRKKFVQKMINDPIPEKIKFAKKFWGIDLLDEPHLPNA